MTTTAGNSEESSPAVQDGPENQDGPEKEQGDAVIDNPPEEAEGLSREFDGTDLHSGEPGAGE